MAVHMPISTSVSLNPLKPNGYLLPLKTLNFSRRLFVCSVQSFTYEGWNFNFSNTPLDWIQELLE